MRAALTAPWQEGGPDQEGRAAMETDRPFREWPLEQLAEQAILHAADPAVLDALAAEVARRPGSRAKALLARIQRLREEARDRQRRDTAGPPRGADTAALRDLLAAAAGEIARLRARLAATEARGADGSAEAALPHRRVHLTPDAPAWLVAEVRRAFRRRYHPDRHGDPAPRRRAEEIFKRAEAVFAAIERGR
jgi:hypothetical protein